MCLSLLKALVLLVPPTSTLDTDHPPLLTSTAAVSTNIPLPGRSHQDACEKRIPGPFPSVCLPWPMLVKPQITLLLDGTAIIAAIILRSFNLMTIHTKICYHCQVPCCYCLMTSIRPQTAPPCKTQPKPQSGTTKTLVAPMSCSVHALLLASVH
jgi:hypothetical protein